MIRPVLAARGMIGGALAAAAGGAVVWYTAGGAPTPVAAYQPKGAASLAASYSNLANPGTNDAAPGVAPTWDATNGWTFNGTTQYLDTFVSPDLSYSAIVRFSGCAGNAFAVFGAHSADNRMFGINPNRFGFAAQWYNNDLLEVSGQQLTSGTMGIAGNKGYRNGAAVAGTIPVGAGIPGRSIYVGATHRGLLADFFKQVNVQAFALYSSTLDAAMVAAVSAAMAAL